MRGWFSVIDSRFLLISIIRLGNLRWDFFTWHRKPEAFQLVIVRWHVWDEKGDILTWVARCRSSGNNKILAAHISLCCRFATAFCTVIFSHSRANHYLLDTYLKIQVLRAHPNNLGYLLNVKNCICKLSFHLSYTYLVTTSIFYIASYLF